MSRASMGRQSRSSSEQQLEPHHPDTAETLHDFATLREQQERHQEALALLEQALGMPHPKTRATRERLTALRERIGQEAGVPPEDSLPEQRE